MPVLWGFVKGLIKFKTACRDSLNFHAAIYPFIKMTPALLLSNNVKKIVLYQILSHVGFSDSNLLSRIILFLS